MLTYLRYALATVCLAASVGCLGMWEASLVRLGILDQAVLCVGSIIGRAEIYDGIVVVSLQDRQFGPISYDWNAHPLAERGHERYLEIQSQQGKFGSVNPRDVFFPLWYPALIFALAGVASLRLGRRFTLRSALIATTVVAGLLGMVVGL